MTDPSPQMPPEKKTPLWRKKRVWIPLGVLAVLLLTVGPWPVYSKSYHASDYARETFARVDALSLDLARGELRAAAATVDITPRSGEPLAGYGDRWNSNAAVESREKLRAEAVSVSTGGRTITVVGGDFLLFMESLRKAVLEEAGVEHRDVLFTSSHTHGGPGGYAPGIIERIALGAHDPAVTRRLVEAFASAIRRSRQEMQPVRMASRVVTPQEETVASYCRNRLAEDGEPHGTLAAVSFWRDGNAVATLVVASPHPTSTSSRDTHPSADYPGVLKQAIESDIGGTCLFAVGATGSMTVTKQQPKGPLRARAIGQNIYRALKEAGALSPPGSDAPNVIGSAIAKVSLPPYQYRISRQMRLSPILTAIVHSRDTYVHALRLGQVLLVGMPCDFSGELALKLERSVPGSLRPVITSLNGDYIGYVVPQERYTSIRYETQGLNFFGPWCGEYLLEIAQRLTARAGD